MKVYFLSYRKAALKLDGIYLGLIDGFERHVDIDLNDGVFVEVLPENNAEGVSFILDKKFIGNPPDFCDVYIAESELYIRVKKFSHKSAALKVIAQTRQFGCLYTVFSQGDISLCCEGKETTLTPLPDGFAECEFEAAAVDGLPVMAFYGGDWLCAASAEGKVLFLNRVESREFDGRLKVLIAFETCAAVKARCEFAFDGEKLKLVDCKTEETRAVDSSLLHFAFFESVLTRADCAKYLCGELKDRAGMLKDYLGEFTGVTIPPESFYYRHGDIPAAGLVYRQKDNLFKIKYFAVQLQDGKIANIYEVD